MAGRYGRRSPGRHGLDESSSGIAWDRWLDQQAGQAARATLPSFPDDPGSESLAEAPAEVPVEVPTEVPAEVQAEVQDSAASPAPPETISAPVAPAPSTLTPEATAPEPAWQPEDAEGAAENAAEDAAEDATKEAAEQANVPREAERATTPEAPSPRSADDDLSAAGASADSPDGPAHGEGAEVASPIVPATHASRLAHAELGPIPGLEDADPTMVDEPADEEEGPRDYLPAAHRPGEDDAPEEISKAGGSPSATGAAEPTASPASPHADAPAEPEAHSSRTEPDREPTDSATSPEEAGPGEDSLFARVNAEPEPPASESPDTDEFEIDSTGVPVRAVRSELKDYLEIGAYQGMLLTVGLGILFFVTGNEVPYTLGHILIAPLIVAGTVGLAATYLHGIARKSRRFAIISAVVAGIVIIPVITAIVLLGQKVILFIGSPWWWLALTIPFVILAIVARRMTGGKPATAIDPDDDEQWKLRTGEILRTVKQMSDERVAEILADCEASAAGSLSESFGAPEVFARRFEVDREAGRRRLAVFNGLAAIAFVAYAVIQFFSRPAGTYTIAIALILAAITANSWWRNRSPRED